MSTLVSRRQLLRSLPALATLPLAVEGRAAANGQPGTPRLRARALNHVTLWVSDVSRSVEFYQGLFGLPIQARRGETICLRVGTGPQFLELAPAPRGNEPRIDHFGLGIEDFDVDHALAVLRAHGVEVGPNAVGDVRRARSANSGIISHGVGEPTRTLYVNDPDGTLVHLQGASYCGGAGRSGDACSPAKPPTSGKLTVHDLSHLTIASHDARATNQFYQDVFGLPVRAHQGASPLLGVGSGVQFLMFTGGGAGAAGQPPRPSRIDHVCLSLPSFDVRAVTDSLASVGIKARGAATGRPGPMVSYVSMRMPNRGGAPEGTPELYFTDPDGIAIQLQDVRYCGGSGVLGDVCPS
jgi:catechol 2,3-dioxygenase-like lactoylglutathione lyase family enzyme